MLKWVLLVTTFACINSQAQTILYFSLPEELKVDAGIDTTVLEGDKIRLGGLVVATGGTGSYQYTWLPIEGLSDPHIANPIAVIDSSITYTLTVTDEVCQVTSTITLSVEKITRVEDLVSAGWKVYPNPNEGTFVVEMNNLSENDGVLIQVFNPIGQLIQTKELNGSKEINEQIIIDTSSKGIYFLIVMARGRKAYFKIEIR